MNIEQLKEKYQNIEDKIPTIWENYDKVAFELNQDLENFQLNSISDPELIRVISLVSLQRNNQVSNLYDYIDQRFLVSGLYPQKQLFINIEPRNGYKKMLNDIFITRNKNK